VILTRLAGETDEQFLARYNAVSSALGLPDEGPIWSGGSEEQRSSGPDCGRDESGRFGEDNKCQEDAGSGSGDEAPTSTKAAKKAAEDIPLGNVRRQDVMLRGGKSVVVIDREAVDRARQDRIDNPKPEGSHPGSSSDVYGRTFVRRDDPKKPNKITSHDPVFTDDDLAQNAMFVAHDAVGRFLSGRHEDDRRAVGGEGAGAVIDTRQALPPEQFEYVVSALKEDVDRAYAEGRNPGFYSTDIAECMDTMSSMYPELRDEAEAKKLGTTPEDASFVFTMITAITSNGTDPALNLESADRIYRLYREHGSVRTPDDLMGGERAAEIRQSLGRFQDMIDEFGESRVRSIMSGVTHASSIARAMKKLAKKSKEIGGSWGGKDLGNSELADEVVPVAAVFGPKIGSFFANLSGKHQFLTMDRWLMRSVGRVTGELLTRSSPKSANRQANAALRAIRASKGKEILFGVDKPPLSLKRQDVIRSLELQARSGIIEESGAAFEWAKAAQRAYGKVPRGVDKDGKPKGSFGDHPDPQIRAAHKVGNTLSKSLIHEQQDPRSARARRVLREVFREVARRVEADNPDSRADVPVSEIQAVLWQYEQNLWKGIGAKTKIEGDSLYSAAAKSLKARRDAGEKPASLTPAKARRPKSVRSEDKANAADEDGVEIDYQNQAGQDLWEDEVETAGVDIVRLLAAIVGEQESRSDDCGRDEGGKFGPQNKCQENAGAAVADQPKVRVDRSWKKTAGPAIWQGEKLKASPPAKSLANVKSVTMADAELINDSLKEIGVTLDQAAKALAPVGNSEASVQVLHGTLIEAAQFLSDPNAERSPSASLTISSQVPVSGIENAVQTAATLSSTDDSGLVMTYSMFSVSAEAQEKAKFAVAREMMSGVVDSISNAEKLGVTEIMMSAAGSDSSDRFKGYKLWPKLGFDGVIDRNIVTPTWTVGRGFFSPYGSKIPDEILSPRARQEKKAGKLTVQALYETEEGQAWWEKNGRDTFMSLVPGSESPGWKRFEKIREKFSSRSLSLADAFGDSVECRAVLSELWTAVREDARAFCPTGVGNGIDNSCSSSGGPRVMMAPDGGSGGGGGTANWGRRRETEIWTPDKPLYKGAERVASIRIENAKDVRDYLGDNLKMSLPEALLAAGFIDKGADRAGITLPRATIGVDSLGRLSMGWHSTGVATGKGFTGEEAQYADPAGKAVKAVEAARSIAKTRSGIVVGADGFFVHPDFQGLGLAFESHLRTTSVPAARIHMSAERYDSPNPKTRMTGYAHWVKYGYDAPLSRISTRIVVPEEYVAAGAKTLVDVFRLPGGARWWKEVGHSIDLDFDKRPRSKSMVTLLELQDHYEKKSGRRSFEMTQNSRDLIGCDSDDDAWIDEVLTSKRQGGENGFSPTQEEWDRWDAENAELGWKKEVD
jgi:hypothetical protein